MAVKRRSPFLHASRSFLAADRFAQLAQLAQEGKRKEDPDTQMMVKINIRDRWLQGEMEENGMIDVSSPKAWGRVVNEDLENYSEFLRQTFKEDVEVTRIAKEVIIKWRGQVPPQFMEVLNDANGNEASQNQWGGFQPIVVVCLYVRIVHSIHRRDNSYVVARTHVHEYVRTHSNNAIQLKRNIICTHVYVHMFMFL